MRLTAGLIVDFAIQHQEQQNPSALNSLRLREKARALLVELSNFAWTAAPYWWRESEGGTVSLSANDPVGTMPSDFSHFSTQGHPYIQGEGNRGPLRYRQPHALTDLRKRYPDRRSIPELYTLEGRTSAGLAKIVVWPTPGVATVLELTRYAKVTPRIIDKPTRPAAADSGSAGNPNGAYTYQVTFETADGETEGGIVSNSLTVVSKAIALTGIPTDPMWMATARKLYRTEAGGEEHKLVGTVSDNVTTTFTDDIADGALGAAVPTPLTAVSGVEQFPEDFHLTLLLEGLKARLKHSKGDLRDAKGMEDWRREVGRLWMVHQQGQNQAKAVRPYAVAGAGVSARDYYRGRAPGGI